MKPHPFRVFVSGLSKTHAVAPDFAVNVLFSFCCLEFFQVERYDGGIVEEVRDAELNSKIWGLL